MSSVSPSGLAPNLPSLPAAETSGPAPAPASEAAPSYTPLWMVHSAASGTYSGILGLRLPMGGGDLAAMLGQTSLTLEGSIDENEKNKTRMGLAALAEVLRRYDLITLQANVDAEKKIVDAGQATLASAQAATGPLLGDMTTQNTRIAGLRSDIASVQGQLNNSNLSDGDRAKLTARLTELTASLATALADRDRTALALADATAASMDRQIADLQAQIDAAPKGSDKAAQLQSLLNAKQDAVDAFRAQAEAYANGSPHTPAQRDAFAALVVTTTNNHVTDLTTRLAKDREDLQSAKDTLTNAAFLAVGATAQAATAFYAGQEREIDQRGEHELGFEKGFEAIDEGADQASARTQQARGDAVDGLNLATTGAVDQKIQKAAQALLRIVADLVTTLDAQVLKPPAPAAFETVSGRLRLPLV